MAFMQQLPGNGLAQTKFAALTEFDHAADGFASVFPIKAAVMRKTGQRGVEHFLHRLVEAAVQLPLDDLLLLGLEFDRHTFKLAASKAGCNRWGCLERASRCFAFTDRLGDLTTGGPAGRRADRTPFAG